jgi:hypothetical protein
MLLIGDHAPYTGNLLRAVNLVRVLGIPHELGRPFTMNFQSEIEQIVSKLETVINDNYSYRLTTIKITASL